jgi:hypothetical protein
MSGMFFIPDSARPRDLLAMPCMSGSAATSFWIIGSFRSS